MPSGVPYLKNRGISDADPSRRGILQMNAESAGHASLTVARSDDMEWLRNV
jgi:hypothetical protein